MGRGFRGTNRGGQYEQFLFGALARENRGSPLWGYLEASPTPRLLVRGDHKKCVQESESRNNYKKCIRFAMISDIFFSTVGGLGYTASTKQTHTESPLSRQPTLPAQTAHIHRGVRAGGGAAKASDPTAVVGEPATGRSSSRRLRRPSCVPGIPTLSRRGLGENTASNLAKIRN